MNKIVHIQLVESLTYSGPWNIGGTLSIKETDFHGSVISYSPEDGLQLKKEGYTLEVPKHMIKCVVYKDLGPNEPKRIEG